MTDPKTVDLAAKKSEAQWQAAVDRFWLATTPELFKWLSWVAALAALKYISERTHNVWVNLLQGLCFAAIVFYFNAFFFQFHFINPPLIKRPKVRWFVSLAVSSALAYMAGWLAIEALDAIAKSKT